MTDENSPPRVGALEKVATALSALLIAGLLFVLVWDAAHPNAPAAFEVKTDSLTWSGASYRVPVQVRNTGDESARSVIVHVELTMADTTVSETDVTIDWVPGRSTRRAVAIFGRDDARASQGVRAEVRGYAVP